MSFSLNAAEKNINQLIKYLVFTHVKTVTENIVKILLDCSSFFELAT